MQNFEEMSSKQSNAELCNGYVFLRQMHLMWKKICSKYVEEICMSYLCHK